ncbi:uncharacterized protein LOC128200037 [Galleria mellonella]|uniref:Uncharacterized protein LOC128200037 n=1 Tax=Galleria mellonella TaxID=7137 RepID=A0ABM3M939_GALME|nr:uncharacterized protein LOC128200037 [Galleria mellonella]
MIILTTITVALLLSSATTAIGAPSSNEDELTIITEDFFPDSVIKYKGAYDIVQLVVPLNALNYAKDSDDSSPESDDGTGVIFFVEAELDDKGNKDYKGLYVLRNGKGTKLLENGRDAVAVNDDSKTVYLAASDGLYVYNYKENKADKYGTLTDNIIGIEKENSSNVLYIVTDKHEVYKVTDEGTKKTKVEEIKNAQQLVLDYSDNIYYYGEDKQPYVINAEGVKKFVGLPENPTSVTLIKPPFVMEDCVPFASDDKVYYLNANGTSQLSEFQLKVKPTAYGMEAALIDYFAYKKHIYEINLMAIILGEINDFMEVDFLKNKASSIQSIATRSRSGLHP